MIAESKYDQPLQIPSNRPVSELIAKNPNLLRTHLAYFLSITIKNNDMNLLNYLLSADTSYNHQVWNDFLLQCAELGKCDMITLLLQKGRNANVQNEYGETPMHIAASKGDSETIKILQAYKANCFIKTKENLTPYEYAIEQGNKKVIQLLKRQKNNSMRIEEKQRDTDKNEVFSLGDHQEAKSLKKNDLSYKMNINKLLLCKLDKKQKEVFNQPTSGLPQSSKNITKTKLEKFKGDAVPIKCTRTNTNKLVKVIKYENIIKPVRDLQVPVNKVKQSPQSPQNAKNKEDDNNYGELFYFPTDQQYDSDTIIKQEEYYEASIKRPSDNVNDVELVKLHDVGIHKINPLALDESNHLNSPVSFNNCKDRQGSGSSNIDTNQSNPNPNSSEKNSLDQPPNRICETQSNDEVFVFLNEIELPEYTQLLIKHGFDDINLIIEQTKKSIAITEQNLSDAGINLPGDRAKILIHLEEKANLFEFDIKKDSVYYKQDHIIPSINKTDRHIQKLNRLLSSIKMENYLDNFINAGYPSADLIFVQMISRQPLTDFTLHNDIGIEKIGYRARLLTKFRDEANNYKLKFKNMSLVIDNPKTDNELCNCFIY